MTINSKFDIGDEVYAVYIETDDIIRVFTDTIVSITITEDKTIDYLLDNYCDTFKENELVKIEDKESLVQTIDRLIEASKIPEDASNSEIRDVCL